MPRRERPDPRRAGPVRGRDRPALRRLTAAAVILFGGAGLWVVLSSAGDLRGRPSVEPLSDLAVMEATQAGRLDFGLDDCVPGSVRPYALARAGEVDDIATQTIVVCRSRSSATLWLGVYALGAGMVLALCEFVRRRRPSGT